MSNLADLAVERAVLGGICSGGREAFEEVGPLLQVDTFTDKTNQAIFCVLQKMLLDREMDTVDKASFHTVALELQFEWLWKNQQDKKYLATLINAGGTSTTNLMKLTARIRRLQIARLALEQLDIAKAEVNELTGEESVDHILGLLEGRIFDFSMLLHGVEEGQPTKLGEGILEYLTHLRDNPVEMVGISTGWPRFDESIGGGLRRKAVTVVGARTGVGKGQIGINTTLHVAGKLGIPVLYLDTEMGKEDHWNRTIANKSGVPINEIETGQFGKYPQKVKSIFDAADEIKDIPYTYVDVAGKPFEEIISIMRRWVKKEVGFDEDGNSKPCLVIFDYIKLMSADSITQNLQEYQILGFQMTGLHNFAFRNNVPILTFVQLNRDGIDKETTAAASGSDRIVWLASNMLIFKPKTDDEIAADGDEAGNRKLIPLKTRHGAGLAPGDYICMEFEGGISRITELGTKIELTRDRLRNQMTSNDISIDNVDIDMGDFDDEEEV